MAGNAYDGTGLPINVTIIPGLVDGKDGIP